MEAFKADYEKNDKLLKSILGENFTTHVMRAQVDICQEKHGPIKRLFK